MAVTGCSHTPKVEMAGSGDSRRMRSVRVESYVRGYHVYRGLPGPCLGFLLGGSAEGVQRTGSGSSKRSKKLVILAAIALEHSTQIYSHARASFGHSSSYASPFAIFLTSIF